MHATETPPSKPSLTPEELRVLRLLKSARDRNAVSVACNGKDRAPAHALEKMGYAEWHGEQWGSSFWYITVKGYDHEEL